MTFALKVILLRVKDLLFVIRAFGVVMEQVSFGHSVSSSTAFNAVKNMQKSDNILRFRHFPPPPEVANHSANKCANRNHCANLRRTISTKCHHKTPKQLCQAIIKSQKIGEIIALKKYFFVKKAVASLIIICPLFDKFD